jgi:hypothetical protein
VPAIDFFMESVFGVLRSVMRSYHLLRCRI